MLTGSKNRCSILGHDSADGQATGQTLGQGHYIRFNTVLLVGKKCPHSAYPGLNLIQNKQDTRLVAPGAYLGQVIIVGQVHTSLPLHRLKHHGTGLGAGSRLYYLNIIVLYIDKSRWQRKVWLLEFRLAGGGYHSQGTPVK